MDEVERVHVEQEVDLLAAHPVRELRIAHARRGQDRHAELLRHARDGRASAPGRWLRQDRDEVVLRPGDHPQHLDSGRLLGHEQHVHWNGSR
jgi:hypothetical protein